MIEILASLFILLGAFFCLLAAIGVLRFKDSLSRIHAATKVGSFGGSCLLMAALLQFRDPFVSIEVILIIGLFYLTTPIASHLLGRVAAQSVRPKPSGESPDPP
jgi:multicomponent Na+:H+ antiporter subunit G